MAKDNRVLMMRIMLAVIIVLALVLIYFFVVRPTVDKFVFDKQVEAANIVTNNFYADMLTQLQTTGAYQLQVGNQTLVLVPYVPPQA